MLPHTPFGQSSLATSPLGIGTVKWGRTEGLKHAPFSLPNDATLHQLLDTAEAAGINVLDSAPAYGLAESRLGSLLASRPNRFHVFTKAGESFSHGASHWDFSESAIRRSIENSLRLLRTDCLDAVTLHCPRHDLSILSQSDAPTTLTSLKSEGKIHLAGFSVMSLDAGLLAVPHFDYLMVAWNPGFLEHQPVIEAAALARKGILLKKVLSSGSFTSASPADSLRAALHLPGNPVILAGTINPHHLHDNIAALRSKRVPPLSPHHPPLP